MLDIVKQKNKRPLYTCKAWRRSTFSAAETQQYAAHVSRLTAKVRCGEARLVFKAPGSKHMRNGYKLRSQICTPT